MKIGILTGSKNHNYGGCLQALALQRFISSLGYDCELIDYEPLQSVVTWRYDFCKSRSELLKLGSQRSSLIAMLRKFLNILFFQPFKIQTILRNANCFRFWRQHLKLSETSYKSETELADKNDYDVIVVGSDQLWSPVMLRLDKGSLLSKIKSDIRKISYATSVATDDLGGMETLYGYALKDFSAISVREKTSCDLLEKVANRSVEWVVDPTFLLTAEDWRDELNISEKKQGNHIVVYWLSDLPSIIPSLVDYAHKTNQEIHLYLNIRSFVAPLLSIRNLLPVFRHLKVWWQLITCRNIRVMKFCDAGAFISDLSSCFRVVTNSFHGMAFSIIFGKKLCLVLDCERKSMWSRMQDFLNNIGLVDLIFYDLQSALFLHENSELKMSSSALKKLTVWVDDSKAWLKRSLS